MISVFFDLDGVLADFVRGALAVHNRSNFPIKQVPWKLEEALGIEPSVFWKPMGYEFWRDLLPMQDGFALLGVVEKIVKPEQIGLFTSCCLTDGCYDGKKAWVKKYLPTYTTRLFTGSDKFMHAGPTKILLDDRNDNVLKWITGGGRGVLIPRPWNPLGSLTDDNANFRIGDVLPHLNEMVLRARSVEP